MSKKVHEIKVKQSLYEIKEKAKFEHQQLVPIEWIVDVIGKDKKTIKAKGQKDHVGHKLAEQMVSAKRAKKL